MRGFIDQSTNTVTSGFAQKYVTVRRFDGLRAPLCALLSHVARHILRHAPGLPACFLASQGLMKYAAVRAASRCERPSSQMPRSLGGWQAARKAFANGIATG